MNPDALKQKVLSTLKGFSPSQLVIIGLLSVLGVTGAVFFMKWVSTPSYGVLLAGLDAKDASAVTAKLDADGVSYKLSGGGSTVLVPQASLDKERIAVASAGLPAGSTQDGWAAFDKQGLTSSSFQQQVAYQRALEQTLAGSLQEIEGVRSAQVHLALPEKRLFSENQDPARASVLLQTSGSLSDDTVDAMTHLVSSAVPGLAPKDVSITDGSGTLLTGDGTSGSKTDAARKTYEAALEAQVTSMFDTLLGPGRAVVRVNAQMDTSSTTIDKETYDPKATVPLTSSQSSETYTPTPGASANPGGVVTTGSATGSQTTTSSSTQQGYSKTESTTTTGVSKTVSHEVLAPGGVKRLTVAVVVDSKAKNAPTTADISAMVANAVGLNTARGDTISVTTPAFLVTDAEKAAAAKPAKPSMTDMAKDYGPKVLGGLLLLFVGLGFLKTLKKGTEIPAAQITAAVEAGKRGALPKGSTTTATALPAGSVPAPRGSSDLLGTLDENPDEVAGLLRGWMAGVGGDR